MPSAAKPAEFTPNYAAVACKPKPLYSWHNSVYINLEFV